MADNNEWSNQTLNNISSQLSYFKGNSPEEIEPNTGKDVTNDSYSNPNQDIRGIKYLLARIIAKRV